MKIEPTREMSVSMQAYRVAVTCVLTAAQTALDKGDIDNAAVLLQRVADDTHRIVSVFQAVSTMEGPNNAG